jgi:hypothetical protein
MNPGRPGGQEAMIITEPSVAWRDPRPCVFVPRTVTMATIASAADEIPGLFGWLAARDLTPAGPPFLRYNVIDMERELQLEAGVPVATPATGEGRVEAGMLPGGRYAVAVHTGPYDQLVQAVSDLLGWAAQQGLTWDKQDSAAGERWGGRLESYPVNPAGQPDPAKWETELAFRLAD